MLVFLAQDIFEDGQAASILLVKVQEGLEWAAKCGFRKYQVIFGECAVAPSHQITH